MVPTTLEALALSDTTLWQMRHDLAMDLGALVDAIMERPGPTRLVAIDAPGGAGKSTFAAQLAAAAGSAPVLHTDDFASDENPTDWWPRMLAQVIEPLARGDVARFHNAGDPLEPGTEWRTVEPAPIVIIEGVSAGRAEWAQHLSFIIWIDTSREERLRRGLRRDGPESLADWESWMTGEDAHYARDPTHERADVIVDGHTIDDPSDVQIRTRRSPRPTTMPTEHFEIETERLVLRPWRSTDRSDFADMNAHPEEVTDSSS